MAPTPAAPGDPPSSGVHTPSSCPPTQRSAPTLLLMHPSVGPPARTGRTGATGWALGPRGRCRLTSPAQTGDKGVEGRAGAPSECLPEAHIPAWAAPRAGQAKPTQPLRLIAQASHPPGGHSLGVRRPPLPSAPRTLCPGDDGPAETGGWGDGGERPAPAHTLRSPPEEKNK